MVRYAVHHQVDGATIRVDSIWHARINADLRCAVLAKQDSNGVYYVAAVDDDDPDQQQPAMPRRT